MLAIFNRKGITPIISVILLLMMTIAIAGLAYTFLQSSQSTIQTSTENISNELLTGLKVRMQIDGYYLNCSNSQLNITVRNSGTEKAKNLNWFINDALQTTSSISLNAGAITSFNRSVTCTDYANATKTFKISADQGITEQNFKLLCSEGSC